MALISCPDCGRQVSDLAHACPQCARPIAETLERAPERRVARSERPDDAGDGLDPGILARRHRDRVGAQQPGVIKRCITCGRDVTQDLFRQKTKVGYVCAECQDKEIDRYVAWRNRWGRVVWITVAVVVAGAAIVVAMSVVTGMQTSKSDAVEPVKK